MHFDKQLGHRCGQGGSIQTRCHFVINVDRCWHADNWAAAADRVLGQDYDVWQHVLEPAILARSRELVETAFLQVP